MSDDDPGADVPCIMSLHGRVELLAVEYKAHTGKLRPEQARWIAQLNAVAPGSVIALIIRPAEMPQLAAALRQHGAWAPSSPHTNTGKGQHK